MDADRARRILGVGPAAERDAVDAAFRAIARRTHPDRGGDATRFREVLAARAVLVGRPVHASATRRPPAPVVVVPDVSTWDQVRGAVRTRRRRATAPRRVI